MQYYSRNLVNYCTLGKHNNIFAQIIIFVIEVIHIRKFLALFNNACL